MTRWIPLALCAVALTGCRAFSQFHPPAVFDDDNSVNVAMLPDDWPEHQELTEIQQEVLEERGEPDLFRVWWDDRGRLVWGPEIWTRYRRQSMNDVMQTAHRHGAEMPFTLSWIYQDPDQHPFDRETLEVFRGEEVIFLDDDECLVEPIDDMLGTVLDYGDPEVVREPEDWRGVLSEAWQYYGRGRVFHYVDGDLVRVEVLPPTPVRVHSAF